MTTHYAGEERIIGNEKITLIEYNSYKDCKVLLSDGVISSCSYKTFKNRKTPYSISTHARNIGRKNSIDRVGEKRNINGSDIEIIRYSNNHDLDILLADGNIIKNTRYDNFTRLKSSTIKDRLNKMSLQGMKNKGKTLTVNKPKYNVAVLDSICVENNGELKKSYIIWNHMLKRSYSKEFKDKNPTYKDVKCCEDWNKYSNFEKWYNDNYYELENESMSLDKDILIKGNKIYSPSTCLIVPQRVNTLFVKREYNRKLLIGVYEINNKNNSVYTSKISKKDTVERLGTFRTQEEAFYAYKKAKELYIKQVADEYKAKYHNFPQILYNAMYSYEVEITD